MDRMICFKNNEFIGNYSTVQSLTICKLVLSLNYYGGIKSTLLLILTVHLVLLYGTKQET